MIVECAVGVELARWADDDIASPDLHPLVGGLDEPPASSHDHDLSAEVEVRRGGAPVTGRHHPDI